MEFLKLPTRTQKPRRYGLTSIHDIGIPIGELKHILADYHPFLDIAKFGIGTAYVTPRLTEKIALYTEYGVTVCFGGTLFEKFYHQSTIDQYVTYLKSLGVSWVEVSTGTLDIPLSERVALVYQLSQEFTVLAEVGSKDPDHVLSASQWIEEIQTLLAAGCRYVIAEGRASGTAGIYRANGDIRSGLIAEILNVIDYQQIIFEAPKPSMQLFFINLVGTNVNLGNIPPRDLLLIETERCGLRSETFFIGENNYVPA